jgi:hypothetical protein
MVAVSADHAPGQTRIKRSRLPREKSSLRFVGPGDDLGKRMGLEFKAHVPCFKAFSFLCVPSRQSDDSRWSLRLTAHCLS